MTHLELGGYLPMLLMKSQSRLPTLCLKKVWKLCEVLNVYVAAGHRPTQGQEMTAGTGHLSFLSEPTDFFCKTVKLLGFLLGVL